MIIMNILILTNEYPYEKYPRANWTKAVPYFAEEWARMGHKVVVIVNTSTFPAAYYWGAAILSKIRRSTDFSGTGISDTHWKQEFFFVDQGVTVFNRPMLKYRSGGKYSKKAIENQIGKIKGLLKEEGFVPDVITAHWINPQLYILVQLGAYYNAKTAFVFHRDYEKKRCEKYEVAKYIGMVDHVGCRSKTAAERISEYLPLNSLPFVCSSGIPETFIRDADLTGGHMFCGDKMRIVTAGRLVKYKCFDAVIRTFDSLKKNNPDFEAELTIVGDGPEKEALAALGQERGLLNNSLFFTGRISREAVQNYLKNNDVFVLISKNETFGLVYLEAMLQGCIVVASRFGGVDGIIIDGENGFLCEENNEEQLAEILDRIRNMTAEEKRTMSAKAIQTACEYTDFKAAEKYLKAITG